jgi:hypothetical protein
MKNYLNTGALTKELGVAIQRDFIKRQLKIEPAFETRTIAYWDDIDLIRKRLAKYILNGLSVR